MYRREGELVAGRPKRPELENEAAADAEKLKDYFLKKGHAIVAYSGGVTQLGQGKGSSS